MSTSTRLPPHDLDAERALLGGMLLSIEAAQAGFSLLTPIDFYHPRHQQVFALMVAHRGDGQSIEAVTIAADLKSLEPGIEWLPLLLECQNACPAISLAPRYAAIVADHSRRRQIIALAADVTDQAYGLADPGDIMDRAKTRLTETAIQSDMNFVLDDLTTFQEFVSREHAKPVDWAIPNVLTRDERLLIVAPEGAGKGVLIRQMAIALGGGVHPFTQRPCPPLPTLYLDLENPARTVAHQANLSLNGGRRILDENNDSWILHRPAGIDLRTTAAQVYLEKALQFVQPAVLCIGPVYKAARKQRNENWEDATLELFAVLDDLRTRFHCALILEHHAPKGSTGMRELMPFGSSAWLRWPDYGVRLEPDGIDRNGNPVRLNVGTFRGSRMEVTWPDYFTLGGSENLPWTGLTRPR